VRELSARIKKEMIKLLKEDEEFRYTIAGLMGIQDISKGIDRIEEEQRRLREDFNKMLQEQRRLREDFNKMLQEQEAMREEQRRLREDFNVLSQEQRRLREDFNKMLKAFQQMDKRLTRIEKTVEKMTIDIEDEARSFVRHKLMERGISVDVDVLKLPEAEINIYGANKEYCVIGEASIRAGLKILDEIVEKYELLARKYPNYLREKIILVLYVLIPVPELIKEAEKRNIWVFKATKEYVPLDKVLKRLREEKT